MIISSLLFWFQLKEKYVLVRNYFALLENCRTKINYICKEILKEIKMIQEFKRLKITPILFLITAGIACVNVVMQVLLGQSALALLWTFGAALFFINGIWNLTTPFVKIDNGTIFINYALLKKKEFMLTDIERMDFSSEKRIELYLKDSSRVVIPLGGMDKNTRPDFIKYMMDIEKKP